MIERGEARAKRGSRRIPITDLGVEGEYRYDARHEESHVLMGANLALVRVDPETGGVELLRYGISYDVGKAMNPLTLEGQVEGAAVQGSPAPCTRSSATPTASRSRRASWTTRCRRRPR